MHGNVAKNANSTMLERRNAALPRGLSSSTAIFADRAENAELWDVEGKRYIDFASGIAVLNTGHNHPRIVAAVQAQLARFGHTAFQVVGYDVYVGLAERLNALTPGPSPKKTLFVTTGAEANENAIKIARAYTRRSDVIAFAGGFHGRTLLGMALTGKVVPYKSGFGPFPSGIHHVPFPSELHGISEVDSLAAIQRLFTADVDPANVAAIIIEPVQGEGGFYVASSDFLQSLRQLCDVHGILLIIDEVQSGFARTGRLFAHERAGIEADLVPMAKSLAGGFPLAAVTGKAEVMDAPNPGGLGGTFGGAPISCAAAHAVLDVIADEGLCERAQHIGALMTECLFTLQATDPGRLIAEVRGVGAMVAFELAHDGDASRPASDLAKRIISEATNLGLVLLACGMHGNVIRLIPPLTATDAIIAEGLDLLKEAFVRACK